MLMAELLKNFNSPAAGVETVFNKPRIAISRASDGAQVPSVASSLLEDVQLAPGADKSAERAGS